MVHRMCSGLAVLALPALLVACGGSQPTAAPQPEAETELPPDRFSSRRVLGELEMLMAFRADGPSEATRAAARRHIRGALEEARIAVDAVETVHEPPDGDPLVFEHLVATLPGDSADRFVLVAPLDALAEDSVVPGDPLSGAALLVELARVFAHRDFPYTLQFVWIDGESAGAAEDETQMTSQMTWLGGRTLARAWAEEGRLDDVRLLVAVNRVCDPELEIARDLASHRNHRDQFFGAARALGRAAAFPTDRPFARVVSSHLAFRRAGLRPVVGLEDAGSGAEGSGPRSEEEASGTAAPLEVCSAASLDTVGLVLVEGLDRIGARLAKIDRFARVPQVEEPEEEPAPQPEPEPDERADAPSGGGGDAAP